MQTFELRPIEAIQFLPENEVEIKKLLGDSLFRKGLEKIIITPVGYLHFDWKDWIVKGEKYYYPIEEKVFENKYIRK